MVKTKCPKRNQENPDILYETWAFLSKQIIDFYVAFSFSCGRSHLLERVCEVDLEACQLLIHGFLLNKNGSYVSEGEESQTEETEDMEDAFLTSKWEQSNCFSVNSSKQKSFRHPLIGKKHQSTPCELKEVSIFFLYLFCFPVCFQPSFVSVLMRLVPFWPASKPT